MQKKIKNMWKKLSLSTNPGDFKGTTFQKNVMGGYIQPRINSLQILFLVFFNKKLLYTYTEKSLNGEISTKSVCISVNNIVYKIFRFFLSTIYGIN